MRKTPAGGVSTRRAHQHRVAAQRVQRRAEADVISEGSSLAEPRHGDDDHVEPQRPQARVVEPPVAHHPRAEVVDDHVAGRGQPLGELHAARLRHIEDQALLAAVEVSVKSSAPLAEVERHRTLDLDHFGAVVGEDACGERSGHHVGEIEHANAVEHPPSQNGVRRLFPRKSCLTPFWRPRVLAELRRGAARAERRAGHMKGRSGKSQSRSRDRREEPAVGELRVVEQRLRRAHRSEGQAAQLRTRENLLGRQVRGRAVEHSVDLLGVLAANVEVVPLLARELGAEAALHQPADECRPIAD